MLKCNVIRPLAPVCPQSAWAAPIHDRREVFHVCDACCDFRTSSGTRHRSCARLSCETRAHNSWSRAACRRWCVSTCREALSRYYWTWFVIAISWHQNECFFSCFLLSSRFICFEASKLCSAVVRDQDTICETEERVVVGSMTLVRKYSPDACLVRLSCSPRPMSSFNVKMTAVNT